MTEEEREKREENRWLKSVQNKFKKLISDLRWDSLELSDTEYMVVTYIMNAKDSNDLPVLVDERLVDFVLENVRTKMKSIKAKGL